MLERILIDVLGPALATLLAALFAYLTALIRRKVKNEKLRGALETLNEIVAVTVKEAFQTAVDQARSRTEDGKLTPEDGQRIKQEVVEKILNTLNIETKKALVPLAENLAAFVSSLVESTVFDIKSEVPHAGKPTDIALPVESPSEGTA